MLLHPGKQFFNTKERTWSRFITKTAWFSRNKQRTRKPGTVTPTELNLPMKEIATRWLLSQQKTIITAHKVVRTIWSLLFYNDFLCSSLIHNRHHPQETSRGGVPPHYCYWYLWSPNVRTVGRVDRDNMKNKLQCPDCHLATNKDVVFPGGKTLENN